MDMFATWPENNSSLGTFCPKPLEKSNLQTKLRKCRERKLGRVHEDPYIE